MRRNARCSRSAAEPVGTDPASERECGATFDSRPVCCERRVSGSGGAAKTMRPLEQQRQPKPRLRTACPWSLLRLGQRIGLTAWWQSAPDAAAGVECARCGRRASDLSRTPANLGCEARRGLSGRL